MIFHCGRATLSPQSNGKLFTQTGRRLLTFLLTVAALKVALSGCATKRLTLEAVQEDALISLADPESGQAATELGTGSVVLEGEQTQGKAYWVSADGFKSVVIYLPEGVDDEKLKVRLPETGGNDEGIDALREQLQSAQDRNNRLKEEMETQRQYFEAIAQPLSRTEHYLTLRSPENAKLMLDEIEKAGDQKWQPSYALVLRAKLYIAEGNNAEAKLALESALQRNPALLEARQLLEALNGN